MKYYLLNNENLSYFEDLYDNNEEWDADDSIIIGAFDEADDNTLIPCGVLKSDNIENIYNIKWLYVDADYRLQGVGTGLLNTLKDAVKNSFFKIQYVPEDSGMVSFLDKYGFDTTSSKPCYFLSFDISDLDPRIRKLSTSRNIMPVNELSKEQVILLNDRFKNLTKEERITRTIQFPLSQYYQDSICYVKDNKILAYIILEQPKLNAYDSIIIKSIYANRNSPKELAILLAELYRRIIVDCPKGMTLSISLFDHSKCELLSKIFLNHKIETVRVVEISV